MKYIKKYESTNISTHRFVEKWLEKMGIRNYSINDDLSAILRRHTGQSPTISIYGSLNIEGNIDGSSSLKELPYKFEMISGSFNCSLNKLESLKNFPDTIGGSLNCSYNELKSLDSCSEIFGSFNCSNNKLETLRGCPKHIKGNFQFSDNYNLYNFKYFPEKIDGCILYYGTPIGQILGIMDKYKQAQIEDMLKISSYINDYEVIQGKNLYLDRLKECYYMIDFEKCLDLYDKDHLKHELRCYNLIF